MSNSPLPSHPAPMRPEEQQQRRREQTERARRGIEARQRLEATQAAEREQRQRDAGAAALEAYRAETRRRWIGSGGDVLSFEREWPRIEADYLREQIQYDATERAYRRARGLDRA